MRIEYATAAIKTLRGMQPKAAKAMMDRLSAVAAAPFGGHANVERIEGRKDAFRLRQGDWRAIYWIDRAAGTMKVERIAPRGEVYKR